MSDIYVELNLSSEVHDIAHHGYQLFRELEIGYEAAKTLVNQAIAFGQEGKTAKSLETFGEAKRLFIKEKNEVTLAMADRPLSGDRLVFCRPLLRGAPLRHRRVEIFRQSLLRNKAAICHFLLAQTAIHTGDLDAAGSESWPASKS